jgi:glycosyltransferase involved in cell wall biosynthesis
MKILIATPCLPWPLHEGGRVAQYRTLEALQAACDFTLLFPAHCEEHEKDAAVLSERLPRVRIVPVRCYEPPQPPPPPPKPTFRRFVGRMLRKIFPPPKPISKNSAEVDRKSIKNEEEPVPYYQFDNLHPHFVEAVDRELDKGYEIFQAEFCDMLSLGPIVGNRAKKLFIHHQLHFIYAERFLKSLKKPSAQARSIANRMRCEEKTFLEVFDAAVVFSEVDAKLLNDFCPKVQVEVSPFPSPENPTSHSSITAGEVNEFVFVASESHRPNAMGFAWFMEEVWPIIKKKLPNASITVVGIWSPHAQASLPNNADIQFSGFVPELSSVLAGKIMVVPLWVGSGVRTKILAAWSCGVPVVSTGIGAEGLPLVDGEHILLADDAPSFAKACLGLAADSNQRQKLVLNAFELMSGEFSLDAVKKRRLEIYGELKKC